MINKIFLFVIIINIGVGVVCFKVKNDTGAMLYLERFGYIEQEDMPENMAMEEALPMLMAFQKMCGIDQTGELDRPTVKMMNTPRCGNKDMMRISINESEVENEEYLSNNRLKRYVVNQYKLQWKSRELTYRLGFFSEEMQKHVTKKQVLDAIHEAFHIWSTATNLDFFYMPDKKDVDLELSFTTRNHPQDGFPFDGPGRVLAHAFPPGNNRISGDVHFEDEEEWRVHSPKGTDVLFVAVHEIGHALGLSHSSTKGAIMQAFYGGYRPKLALHPDDIEGIQSIYGKRETPLKQGPKGLPPMTSTTEKTTTTTQKTTTTTTTPKTTTTTVKSTTTTQISRFVPLKQDEDKRRPSVSSDGRPDLCDDAKIDAITTLNDGKIYIFKGSFVFQISPNGEGVLPGWPNHIGFVFPGLETNIDAVATRENGKTYFFKGSKYWRFTGRKKDPSYPKQIMHHFRNIPENIDSAFVWFGQFYFTKGDKFWRFNPKHKPHVAPIYPLSTEIIWGISEGLDAAFKAPNGHVYFFKNSHYYRMDDGTFRIADSSPAYPRSSKAFWFGCSKLSPDSRNIRKSQSPSDENYDFLSNSLEMPDY